MICEICGNEFKDRVFNGKQITYCSRSCYNKIYWNKYKVGRSEYFHELYKKRYTPHPRELKYKTEEERRKAKNEYSRKHYLEHKEYYYKKNMQWQEAHKNDKDVQERHRAAMRKYYYKKKKEKENDKRY